MPSNRNSTSSRLLAAAKQVQEELAVNFAAKAKAAGDSALAAAKNNSPVVQESARKKSESAGRASQQLNHIKKLLVEIEALHQSLVKEKEEEKQELQVLQIALHESGHPGRRSPSPPRRSGHHGRNLPYSRRSGHTGRRSPSPSRQSGHTGRRSPSPSRQSGHSGRRSPREKSPGRSILLSRPNNTTAAKVHHYQDRQAFNSNQFRWKKPRSPPAQGHTTIAEHKAQLTQHQQHQTALSTGAPKIGTATPDQVKSLTETVNSLALVSGIKPLSVSTSTRREPVIPVPKPSEKLPPTNILFNASSISTGVESVDDRIERQTRDKTLFSSEEEEKELLKSPPTTHESIEIC